MSTVIDGSTGITTDGLVIVANSAQRMLLATAQASTSGTSIDFTSVPTWTKKITIMFNEVSTNGTSTPLVQIGSGSVETSGYISSSTSLANASAVATASSTSGFLINSVFAANILSGHIILTLVGSNLWIASGQLKSGTDKNVITGGSKTTSGTLDRVRITTANGTDAFDAGSINVLYEGY